jgi:transcriptional antiterminator RfaH
MRPRSAKEVDMIPKWYTLLTKSRHEKVVQENLELKGYQTYLPTRTVIKKWSDRKKKVTEPLFKGYVFVYIPYLSRIGVLETTGVVRIVMFNGKPGVLHDYEMTAIKKVLEANRTHGLVVDTIDGISEGDTVEVTNGPLIGLRGQFTTIKNENKLVISIDSIGKSLAVEVPVDWIKKVRIAN